MPSTVQKISRYAIQVLNKRTGPAPRPSIIVRLYDDGGKMVGTAVFKNYGDSLEAELPVGHNENENVTAFFDVSFYEPFVGLLRSEDELYWKIQWTQLGARKEVADVSLDTKEEIIGEYFARG
ncbi:MAG: hypothetical protein JJ900_15210 [Rhodospirillales bacterium]|nr:hypothetical protein [Rhodospirillales bacterium]MBO6788196.1 hypothetical protein [Rhodospirillales bacterium]